MRDRDDVKTIIIDILLLLLIIGLIFGNYYVSIITCNVLNIPFDLSISMVGAGFGIDFIVTLTVIEGICIYYFLQLIKNKLKKIS